MRPRRRLVGERARDRALPSSVGSWRETGRAGAAGSSCAWPTGGSGHEPGFPEQPLAATTGGDWRYGRPLLVDEVVGGGYGSTFGSAPASTGTTVPVTARDMEMTASC